jgi:glycosyltransferase involved in cell wall biosynthesis
MRLLIWHGWLLEGAGSNVYTARVTEVLRRRGHDVLLLCQESHPERYGFLDGWGTVGPEGVSEIHPSGATPAAGRAVLLKPDIGHLLPVFVYDEYEGFEVKRFVDLEGGELNAYLERNVLALREAATWHGPEAVIAGHAVPGPVVARRACGDGRYVAKIHGSDLEYAVRLQARYRELAAEGLSGARGVVGASADVLRRTVELVPEARGRTMVVHPGVDVERFRPLDRAESLSSAAELLARDRALAAGRPPSVDDAVREALRARDREALDRLALGYDQGAPDPDAPDKLRALAHETGPLVGYIGKFIPQKGVHLLIAALELSKARPRALLIGFGLWREWLTALLLALDAGDADSVEWIEEQAGASAGLPPGAVRDAAGLSRRVTFTGRLDHRYAPEALAALDVLVVPSILDEAFAMVAAEGAAAGALPLMARHSGLAELATVLQRQVGRPELFTFEPGPGAVGRLAEGLDRLLGLPADERRELRVAVSAAVNREWTWERTAERLLDAAAPGSGSGSS